MKIKTIFQSAILFASLCVSSQNTVAEKFIQSFNSHDKATLSKILAPDFKLTRTFSDEVTGRSQFLGNYLSRAEYLSTTFKIKAKPKTIGKDAFLVLERSWLLRLLDVKFPTWKLTVRSAKGKVVQAILAPVEDYAAFREDLTDKTHDLQIWLSKNKSGAQVDALIADKALYGPMLEYLQYNVVNHANLQPYDEGEFATVTVLGDEEADALADGRECLYEERFSFDQRMQMYPWNAAKKIMIMSLHDDSKSAEYLSKTNKIPDLSVAIDAHELPEDGIRALSDLIYNQGFKVSDPIPVVRSTGDCPELKNAIVFVDAADRPFEYIEFFFGCDQVELSSKKVTTGSMCTAKMGFFREIFLIEGIPTGE